MADCNHDCSSCGASCGERQENPGIQKAPMNEFSNVKKVIGVVSGNLKRGFPAESINDPDNFVSLLFYFGMLTIDGIYQL